MQDLDVTPSGAELDELAERLAAPALQGRAMDVSTLEGFLTAVLIGPGLVMPTQWIPWVWDKHEGSQDPGFQDVEGANQILGLVMRLHNGLNRRLRDAPEDFEPLSWRGAQRGVVQWCEGFVLGTRFYRQAWELLQNAKPEWFAPCVPPGEDRPAEPVEAGEAGRWRSEVASSVVKMKAFWDFWQEQTQSRAPRAEARGPMPGGRSPVVRKAPKVGRNDPCPCGSGKKYKRCCGAPAAH